MLKKVIVTKVTWGYCIMSVSPKNKKWWKIGGNLMTNAFSQIHSAPWNSGGDYYIRCVDEWENWNECTHVKPSSLVDE